MNLKLFDLFLNILMVTQSGHWCLSDFLKSQQEMSLRKDLMANGETEIQFRGYHLWHAYDPLISGTKY